MIFFNYKHYYCFINQFIIMSNKLINSLFKLIINNVYNIDFIKKFSLSVKFKDIFSFFFWKIIINNSINIWSF